MKSIRAGIVKVGFLFIILFGGLFQIHAQYKVSGEIIDVDFVFHDVALTVVCDGVRNKVSVSNDGKFDTYLDWNKVSLLSFKKPGYVAKVIEFSTKIPDNVYPQSIEPYYLPVRLFKTFTGVDTVFFRNPVAKIRFDDKIKDFADDRDYSLKVKYKVDGMRERGQKQNRKRNNNYVAKQKQNTIAVENSTNNSITNTNNPDKVISPKNELTQGLPPLKDNYPQGRTDERFELQGRTLDRTVFYEGEKRRVYFKVKHDWGGEYFFIDEAQLGYRCVSKRVYHEAIERLVSQK